MFHFVYNFFNTHSDSSLHQASAECTKNINWCPFMSNLTTLDSLQLQLISVPPASVQMRHISFHPDLVSTLVLFCFCTNQWKAPNWFSVRDATVVVSLLHYWESFSWSLFDPDRLFVFFFLKSTRTAVHGVTNLNFFFLSLSSCVHFNKCWTCIYCERQMCIIKKITTVLKAFPPSTFFPPPPPHSFW